MDALRVNLKGRAYDILVGADLLRQAGKMIRPLELGRRLGLVTHPALAETHGYAPAVVDSLRRRGSRGRPGHRSAGGREQVPGPGDPPLPRTGAGQTRSRVGHPGSWRRSDRGPRRIRGGDTLPGHRLRQPPDHTPGPGGQQRRRQDGCEPARGKEPGRRVPSAAAGAGGCPDAPDAAGAGVPVGPGRGREARHDRRCGLLRQPGAAGRPHPGAGSRCAPGDGRPLLRHQGEVSSRETSGRRACAPC